MPRNQGSIQIPTDSPIWSSFFTVAPLVLVASRESDGSHDIAPKHMAMPLGWQNYYCFACSPRHATQRNIEATREFTVSFPRAEQIVQTSMAAAPREPDDSKPGLAALETFPATTVNGVLVADAYLWLECTLERIIDGFGDNSLIIGKVVAAAVDERALRSADSDDSDVINGSPLLAFLAPGRFASVGESYSFPFPADFRL
jgi:flavin reductase (DIM6/NTAB) family NADH-FMN oxidoreductase RutF